MKLITTLGTLLLFSFSIYSQSARLVTDFMPGADDGFSDDLEIIGTARNSIVIADEGNIILSNGFESGTMVIGSLGTDGRVLHNRVQLDEKLYFLIENDDTDYSLIEVDPLLEEKEFIKTTRSPIVAG